MPIYPPQGLFTSTARGLVPPSGGGTSNFLRADGSFATPSGGGGGFSYEGGPPTPPTSTDLNTWDNQGTSSFIDTAGALILKPQVNSVIHGLYKAAPATPYTITCRVSCNILSTAASTTAINAGAGIMFKNTAGGNQRLLFGIQPNRITGDETIDYILMCTRYTGASPPVYVSDTNVRRNLTPVHWIQVSNDLTTFTFKYSDGGLPGSWITIGTETIADFIGGAASFGVAAFGSPNATEVQASFSYFSLTEPI
jgi:hypothetical protein